MLVPSDIHVDKDYIHIDKDYIQAVKKVLVRFCFPVLVPVAEDDNSTAAAGCVHGNQPLWEGVIIAPMQVLSCQQCRS